MDATLPDVLGDILQIQLSRILRFCANMDGLYLSFHDERAELEI